MAEVSLQDLQMMYENCLCRYGGRPILLTDFMSAKEVEFLDLRTGAYGIAPFSLNEFDFTPIRIGYVNYRGIAFYFLRNPIRQYNQGTCADNVSTRQVSNFRRAGAAVERRRQKHHQEISRFNCKEIADAIDRVYPTIPEILATFKGNKYAYSIAFDPQFAVTYEKEVLYRSEVVGVVSTNGKITFNEGHEYLERVMNVNL